MVMPDNRGYSRGPMGRHHADTAWREVERAACFRLLQALATSSICLTHFLTIHQPPARPGAALISRLRAAAPLQPETHDKTLSKQVAWSNHPLEPHRYPSAAGRERVPALRQDAVLPGLLRP